MSFFRLLSTEQTLSVQKKIHGSPKVVSPLWNVYVAMVAITSHVLGWGPGNAIRGGGGGGVGFWCGYWLLCLRVHG